MSPDDYAAASSSLTFAAGETSKTVAVATFNDIFHEPTETFTLGLTNPTNAEIQSGADTATGTITDDDPAPTGVTLSLSTRLPWANPRRRRRSLSLCRGRDAPR